jgi:hypothetical protein
MRKAILATLIALTAGAAIAPASAASLTITTGDNGRYYGDRHDNGVHRGWYRWNHRYRHGMEARRYRTCEVTTHRYWRHGQLIVERTRDCY